MTMPNGPSAPSEAPSAGDWSRHPYAAFLSEVEKPSRYIGGEYQQVRKSDDAVTARVCLAFPDVYEIGMSHLGTKILYSVLNKTPGIACERAFSPWLDLEAQLRKRGLPLVTLESARPVHACDVLGISLQYELTYTNVLGLLDLGGIPLRSVARGDDHPLVLCGGPTATHPEPLAPFIDAFFLGEAEEALPPLCLEVAALRRAGVPRRERLIRLAERYPLYVPELYATHCDPETGLEVVGEPFDPRVPRRPRRVWVADINRFPFPDDSPLPYAEAIFDRMAVEVARGCTEGCRFCQAGMIYRPVRERDPVAVIDALTEGVRKGGYDETSLTSLSTADYSCVTPLVKAAMAKLRDEKVSLSVSSLRAYGLNEDLLADMATMKAQGLTFAPEAGTQRMRDVITKNVTEEDIVESAHRVFARGFQRMKLYFMIGLPTEEDADVLGIVETAARVQDIGRRYFKGAQVTASVSTHVPKPHTPFQWAAMDGEADTARKQGMLAERARALRVGLKMHENHQSHLEGIFSRGDRVCADVLERAFELGCRFDSWDEALRMDLWDQAIDEQRARTGFDPDRYLGTLPVTGRVPWDHLDMALEDGFLAREYRKALKDRLSPPCGKPYKQLLHHTNVVDATGGTKQKLVCYDCGVACDLDAMKKERLYFLRRMNAWTPPAAVAAPARAQAGEVGKDRRSRQPATRLDQGDSERRRYRLRYTKLGRIAYLGHLDLIRHLPRIFRRAGVGLHYSEGFHPKPELSFGPALGLGIPSLAELLDVTMAEQMAPEELLTRLNAVTLEGIDFLGAAALEPLDRGLGRVLARAGYAALLPDPASVASALVAFAQGAPLSVVRYSHRDGDGVRADRASKAGDEALVPQVQGIGRRVDVRRSLLDVGAADPQLAAQVARAFGWPAERVLAFGVAISAEGSARPSEVMKALLGPAVADRTDLARVALDAASPEGPHHVDVLHPAALRMDTAARPAPSPAAASTSTVN